MAQLENIEEIEKRLWNAADTLRANSNYASNEYFMPVMGLIFLRHAYSRFLAVKVDIEGKLPKRGGKTRDLTKAGLLPAYRDLPQNRAELTSLSPSPTAMISAPKPSSKRWNPSRPDYEGLRGVLPKSEYQELDNAVLGQLLRTLNPEELKESDW